GSHALVLRGDEQGRVRGGSIHDVVHGGVPASAAEGGDHVGDLEGWAQLDETRCRPRSWGDRRSGQLRRIRRGRRLRRVDVPDDLRRPNERELLDVALRDLHERQRIAETRNRTRSTAYPRTSDRVPFDLATRRSMARVLHSASWRLGS